MADDFDKEFDAAWDTAFDKEFGAQKHEEGIKTRKKLDKEMGPDIKKLTEGPSDVDQANALGFSIAKGVSDLAGGTENAMGTFGQAAEDVDKASNGNMLGAMGDQALMNAQSLMGPIGRMPLPIPKIPGVNMKIPGLQSDLTDIMSWVPELPRSVGSLIPKPDEYNNYAEMQRAADEEKMAPAGGWAAIAEAAPQALGALMGLKGPEKPLLDTAQLTPGGNSPVNARIDQPKPNTGFSPRSLLPALKLKLPVAGKFADMLIGDASPTGLDNGTQQVMPSRLPSEGYPSSPVPQGEAYQASPFNMEDVGPEPPTSPFGSPPFNMEDLNGTDTSVNIPTPPPSMTLDTPLPRYNPFGDGMFDTSRGIPEPPTIRNPTVENTQTYSPQERMRLQGQRNLNLPHDTQVNAEYSPSVLKKMGLPMQEDIGTVNARQPIRPEMSPMFDEFGGQIPEEYHNMLAQMRDERMNQSPLQQEPDVPQWVRDKQGDTSPPNTFGDKGRPDDEQNILWLEQQIRANKFDKAENMLRQRFGDEYVNYLLNEIDVEDLDLHTDKSPNL